MLPVKHFVYGNIPGQPCHGASPYIHQLIMDEIELSENLMAIDYQNCMGSLSVLMDLDPDLHPKEVERTFWFNTEVEEERQYIGPRDQTYERVGKDKANLIGSLGEDGLHYPVLDLDFPVKLVKTSPGKYHLYLDRGIPWKKYKKLLKAFNGAGYTQNLWHRSALIHRCSWVRPPWAPKRGGGKQ